MVGARSPRQRMPEQRRALVPVLSSWAAVAREKRSPRLMYPWSVLPSMLATGLPGMFAMRRFHHPMSKLKPWLSIASEREYCATHSLNASGAGVDALSWVIRATLNDNAEVSRSGIAVS